MKILNIIFSSSIKQGGPPEVVRNYVSELNKKDKYIYVFKLNSLNFFYFFKSFFFKREKKKLYSFINKFDILHFHDTWNLKSIIIGHLARNLGKKTILIPHGTFDSWSLKEKYLKKKIFSIFFLNNFVIKLDAIFFSTKEEYIEAKKNFKLPFSFIIPNGINLNKFKKTFIKKNKQINKKIVFFGRIHKKKGIEILLKAISKLPSEFFKEFYFEITGPGEKQYIKKISKIIINSKLDKFVKLLPPKNVKEKVDYLKTAAIFILPSYEEADSIALKEAMSLDLPVIISEQCRLNIVGEKKAGFVIKTNVNDITKKLIGLKKINFDQMGNISRNIIEKYFNNENCVKDLLLVYEDIYTGSHISKKWINLNEG